jgi:hypothetical protein
VRARRFVVAFFPTLDYSYERLEPVAPLGAHIQAINIGVRPRQ